MKKLVNQKLNKTVEMKASERLSTEFDAKNGNKSVSTVSYKLLNAVRGKVDGDDHRKAIMAQFDEAKSNSNGNGTIRITMDYGKQRIDDIVDAITNLHCYMDSKLGEIYATLPDEEKVHGNEIAIQNQARIYALEMLQGTAYTATDVDNAMDALNMVYVPDSLQFEFNILLGTKMFSEPKNLQGFKQKTTLLGRKKTSVWTKVGSLYGRKRVPIIGEQAEEMALAIVTATAESFEQAFANVDGANDQAVLDTWIKWCKSFNVPEGYKVTRSRLSNDDLAVAKDMAKEVVDYVRGVNQ